MRIIERQFFESACVRSSERYLAHVKSRVKTDQLCLEYYYMCVCEGKKNF